MPKLEETNDRLEEGVFRAPAQPSVHQAPTPVVDDEKALKKTKIMFGLSCIPPVGCISWVYNRWVNKAEPGSLRYLLSQWALVISTFVALIVLCIVMYSVFQVLFWVFIAILIVVIIAMVAVPRFRKCLFSKPNSSQQPDPNQASILGQRAANAAGDAAYDYAKKNPDKVYDTAKAAYTNQQAYKA